MAARRKPQTRRTPAAATTKPTPTAEITMAPVQSQAAEAAAAALLADARAKADGILLDSQTEAAGKVREANEQYTKLMAEAEQAGGELRRTAETGAGEVLAAAREEAGRLRTEAEGQAAERQAQAELAAQRTEKAAQDRADLLHRQVREDAEGLAADARERADRIGALAVDEAQRIVREAKAEAEDLLAEAREAAERSRAMVDAATADAEQTTRDAKDKSERAIRSARSEADRILNEARAATEKRAERDALVDTWSARLVIAGTVGLTASGEFALARMVGFDQPVAWLLPFVIDVYVIQAFRRHRDIVQAISLTIAANVIFHLADKGLFGVEKVARDGHEPKWWLIALVASVASLILWRMHSITAPPKTGQAVAEVLVTAEERAQDERVERLAKTPKSALTGGVQTAKSERPSERPKKSKTERPPERRERAQAKPKTGAQKSIAERRQERVEALYGDLGKRPEWTDIRDALAAAKLADKSISRSSCQRIRDAVEADKPHLAATGTSNVRPITGGGA